MTDDNDALAAIERATAELLPQLKERLGRHGLGEIEVRSGDVRLRVAAPSGESSAPAQPSTAGEGRAATPAAGGDGGAPRSEAEPMARTQGVPSPAVGFFVYADGLGPGLAVERGGALGYVEMLGIRHDVRAPRGGTVRSLVAESGEPVEYGQVVVEIEPAEGAR